MTQEGLKELAARWLFGQPFTNVLLVALLSVTGWLGQYTITKAIPEHLSTIQQGYESLESSHVDERQLTQQRFEQERTMRIQMYDKWMDRIASSPPIKSPPGE